ncbi:erythromycin esterase family protein [Auraticoccus monumenti]|uniref:Erythromycin esterase homolog n=1 Tax=Auraticoccus monumenti TaxID=675864 RepID=A0A1G6VHM1_9ACTN|nr:erythromycin esterase family protein [Auraticoccus monumenti]SDD53014.1 Erythromycin esterase homolog [Auraticoccus monumenti]
MPLPPAEVTPTLDAGAVTALLGGRPRLLGLGEPTHGSDALLRVRNDLFRQLVEQEGYRTIAVESDCLTGLLVDEHVTSGAGDLDDVVEHGFSHGWGTSPANRDLVRWMRAHNAGRAPAEQVRFAGVDGPLEMAAAASPRGALTALHDHLAARLDTELLPCDASDLDRLLGPDERWTEPAAMFDPSRSVGTNPEVAELRLLTDDLTTLLDTEAPHLLATSSPEDGDRARLHARTAAGLLRYHAAMADPSPQRLARLCALRDAMMAANLLALAERGPTLVHTHAAHLQRHRSSMMMGGQPLGWWSAGAITATRLGEGYAHLATAVGTIADHGVDAPPPDTLEGLLHALPGDRHVVDPARLVPHLDGVVRRVSPWFGYAPLDPTHLDDPDGIVFVRDA